MTIKDAGGLSTTSNVSVTVNQTLTTIAMNPSPVTLNAGGTQQCTATAKDQFGNALSTQPTFTWTTTVGTISRAAYSQHLIRRPRVQLKRLAERSAVLPQST